MNAPIAVAGALAYDQICRTNNSLVSQTAPLLNRKLSSITQAFGGCAGNIAYNLAQLQQALHLLSCTGSVDDAAYFEHLHAHGVDTQHCLRLDDHHCARAVIFTDEDGHQFTGFYPGPVPTAHRWQQHLANIDFSTCRLFIQAPYPAALMLAGMTHVRTQSQPPLTVFVPGQYADQLTPNEAYELVELADWVVGNAHEIGCLQSYHNLDDRVVIRTHGAHPVEIRCRDNTRHRVDVAEVVHPLDPTGCGDAFVAGLCHYTVTHSQGDETQMLQQAVVHACRVAAACLACDGAQHHRLNTLT